MIYVVDVYVTCVHTFHIDATDAEAARLHAIGKAERAAGLPEGEDMLALMDLGFHYADEMEVNVVGEEGGES